MHGSFPADAGVDDLRATNDYFIGALHLRGPGPSSHRQKHDPNLSKE